MSMDLDAMEKAAQERIAAYAARSAGQHAMHIRRDYERRRGADGDWTPERIQAALGYLEAHPLVDVLR